MGGAAIANRNPYSSRWLSPRNSGGAASKSRIESEGPPTFWAKTHGCGPVWPAGTHQTAALISDFKPRSFGPYENMKLRPDAWIIVERPHWEAKGFGIVTSLPSKRARHRVPLYELCRSLKNPCLVLPPASRLPAMQQLTATRARGGPSLTPPKKLVLPEKDASFAGWRG